MLEIYFLGKVRVRYNGLDVTKDIGKKAVALLGLLILKSPRNLSRDKLIAYLWPNSGEETGKYNLRYNLWRLKRSIGPDRSGKELLIVEKDHCVVNGAYSFFCDALDTKKYCADEEDTDGAEERLNQLLELYGGDFLEGYFFDGCDDFNDWVVFERMQMEEQQLRIMEHLVTLYDRQGRMEDKLDTLKGILELDLCNEEVAHEIVKTYMESGRRSLALVWSNACVPHAMGDGEMTQKEAQPDILETDETILPDAPFEKQPLIQIDTACMPGIQWFWVVESVEQLFGMSSLKCETLLNRQQFLDLAYLCSDIVSKSQWDGDPLPEVPEVRIVEAFLHLLRRICRKYRLVMNVERPEIMDEKSIIIFEYLKGSTVKSLKIREISQRKLNDDEGT